jgi:hypothetical protein
MTTNKKVGMMAGTCHSSYVGSINKGIKVQDCLGIK